MRALRVLIDTAVWMVMWRDTEIWAQPGTSNLSSVDFLVPIVSKVDVYVCSSWLVNVIAKKSGQNEYK